jgi:pimeloyl-ACP methyl ester carboxylesterase
MNRSTPRMGFRALWLRRGLAGLATVVLVGTSSAGSIGSRQSGKQQPAPGGAAAVVAAQGSPAVKEHSRKLFEQQVERRVAEARPVIVAAKPTPIEGLFDVGGYKLYLHCIGSGQPTVVLEHGLPGTAQGWAFVQPVVAHTTRVCAYDRAGAGRSDPGPRPRTSQMLVQELHRLLERAQVAPPYVLVGYSFGGLIVRLYTAQYPDEVVGLVLVDATHEDQQARFLAVLPAESPVEDASLKAFRMILIEEWEDATANSEGVTFAATAARVRASGTLGGRPLEVLTASQHGFPHAVAAPAEAAWQAMQLALTQLSSRGVQVVLDGVGHCLPCEQPGTVIGAIRRVVKAVQQP